MARESFTPEQIAALMTDDISDNNGLKEGLSFIEGLNESRRVRREPSELELSTPYQLPASYKPTMVKHTKPIIEHKTPTPTPTPPPQKAEPPAAKPTFGEGNRSLAI